VQSGKYLQKTDNFVVLLDSTGSMGEKVGGESKLTIAKGVVTAMNRTIPDLKLKAGLRVMGLGGCYCERVGKSAYGVTDYEKPGFQAAVETATITVGETKLADGIAFCGDDLYPLGGRSALIVVSDGKQTEGDALSAAKALKRELGDSLCIYTIAVGDDTDGAKLLSEISGAGRCGFSVNAKALETPAGMADFVRNVFFRGAEGDMDGDGVPDSIDRCPDTPPGVAVDARGCPLDSDGDGVYDYLDKCPGTPAGVPVDENGCSEDSDGDGVLDHLDRCPDTPRGVAVDAHGCPLDTDGDGVYDYMDKCPGTPAGAAVNFHGCWIFKGLLFDTAKWDIKPKYDPMLQNVVEILNENPGMKVEIQGHTDNVGSKAYNMNLSDERANSVMNYLIKKGIDPGRLTAKGLGFSNPAASNDTAEGRALNRRVELMPVE
jgi:OOP family OmpA-OmpF porin